MLLARLLRCFMMLLGALPLFVLGEEHVAQTATGTVAGTVADCPRLAAAKRFHPTLDVCFAQAIRAGGEGMQELLATDFSYNTARATRVDGAFLRAWLASAQNRRADVRVEDQRVRAAGTVVVTDGVMVATPVTPDAQGTRRSRYLHVWVREKRHGWRLLARQVTELPATNDGLGGQGHVPLSGTHWRVLELAGERMAVVTDHEEPHLILRADAPRYAATAGCNRLMGGWEVDGERIAFKDGASTMMACWPPLDRQEMLLTRVLQDARHWRIDGRRLELSDERGGLIGVFEARGSRD
ncbi:MAG: META domain-containing protein [Pseudomonadales bacterium]|jgi:heat shock protein HslJ|nr:META domain-containing protein [Pseudomonadales bacterium]MCP5319851.1 META domain-containing protein [Pseudomonadales bacterium]MCP5337891.1 META domain-containing protein [Pseudomonadales bacterium]